MKIKTIFIAMIPFVLLTAYIDLKYIGMLSLENYIIVNLWEYAIFCGGFTLGWFCKKRREK
jgi:hypothetical protein